MANDHQKTQGPWEMEGRRTFLEVKDKEREAGGDQSQTLHTAYSLLGPILKASLIRLKGRAGDRRRKRRDKFRMKTLPTL